MAKFASEAGRDAVKAVTAVVGSVPEDIQETVADLFKECAEVLPMEDIKSAAKAVEGLLEGVVEELEVCAATWLI